MSVTALKIRIATPAGQIPEGRGFYQLEEEALYLPLQYSGKNGRFFSYLESDTTVLHLDRDGRLMFIEISLPKRKWIVREDLVGPEQAALADIRFLDFRTHFPRPAIFRDLTCENVMVRFNSGPSKYNYRLATNLIAQVSEDKTLMAIWAWDIIDDTAGQAISNWRKSLRQQTPSPIPAAP
jgi:hypothetical protein